MVIMAKEVKDVAPAATSDGVLKVVKVEAHGRETRVIVEGTSLERLMSPEARKLAYEQRLKVGMENSGVEALFGTFVPPEETAAALKEKRNVKCWHREFRLVPML
jgi:hypothetical protein